MSIDSHEIVPVLDNVLLFYLDTVYFRTSAN